VILLLVQVPEDLENKGTVLHVLVEVVSHPLHPATVVVDVRNRTLTLIEREDDTRSWGKFLVYFSHSTTMSYPPRGGGYILIGC
jgi:hypothetical protein